MCGAEKQSQRVRAHEGAVRRRKSQWTTDFSRNSGTYIVFNSHMTCSNSSFSLTMVTPMSHFLAVHWLCCLLPIGYLPNLVLWAYASATITEFNHSHSSGDIPISLTGCPCFQHQPYSQRLWAWWHFGNHLVDVMNTAIRVQILDETDCISHCTNTLGKGMNPIILPPAMGK